MAAYGQQVIVRKVFLWGIASIYLFAFISLYLQIPGLYGRNGLMPAKIALRQDSDNVWENFYNKPTLLWYMPSIGLDVETGMDLLCILGIVISLMALVLPSWRGSITFFILWYLYYSLYQVGQTFLWFQWDILLLETGFLAVLVSPLSTDINFHHHDNTMLWLVKWLAFRLMFCSGVVKLASQCPTWWGLTALNWHYESQCIPTPLAWYAHQLPEWFQRLSVVLVYVILMVFSWLFFVPVRSLRIFSFYSQLFFQVLIILTGNYNFFNLLAVLMLLAILDDRHIQFLLPVTSSDNKSIGITAADRSWMEKSKGLIRKVTFVCVIGYVGYWTVNLFDLKLSYKHVVTSRIMFSQDQFFDAIEKCTPISIWVGFGSLCIEILHSFLGCITERGVFRKLGSILQWLIFSFAAVSMFAISLVPYTVIDYSSQQKVWPVIKRLKTKVDYLELVHAYGLFRSMTGVGGRPELNIEGSNSLNGPWKEYGFLYKPVDVEKPLPFVAPHQPRLDWQMWFAALGAYNHNPWFVHLVYRLLHGQQEVLDLMGHNPFSDKPPKYIRANLYTYHYTTLHRNTSSVVEAVQNTRLVKHWWKREFTKEYLPILEKTEPTLISWLNHFGYAMNDPWPEHPSGRLYKLIRYLRSLVRRKDPISCILSVYVGAIAVGYVNAFYF